ncbi:MAG: hypothetical protein EB038_10735, partial [Cyclobacteriaceae bacterium]|nr:hypothetical protein [Cyclobacteriaceae bacterium]
MRITKNSIFWALGSFLHFSWMAALGFSPAVVSLQDDGSLVVLGPQGSIADFVKQGTPRQSVQISGQSCNVSYGFNSAGKKTILVSVPPGATSPVIFIFGENQISIPEKSALRMTLGNDNRVEKLDGNPSETVRFSPVGAAQAGPHTPNMAPTTPEPTD